MVVEEHPDFGKEELNVESGGIFLCVVSQDNLLSYWINPHLGTNLSYPSFSRNWLKNKLVILRYPFSCNLNNLIMNWAIKFKWGNGTIEENRSIAVS